MSNTDLSADAFPFMRSRRLQISGIDTMALRVSFSGDLGWELYCAEEHQQALYQALTAAGREFGLAHVGGRALLSLRVEKGYGSWGREYSPEYWPQEVGLDRLIKLDKKDFLGREAWQAVREQPPREKLVCLALEATNADASGGEPVFSESGEPIGRISSGAYSHTMQQSAALAFIQTPHLEANAVDVAILGQSCKAKILGQPLFDPEGIRLRQ